MVKLSDWITERKESNTKRTGATNAASTKGNMVSG